MHDLHVWTISSGTVALAGHLQVSGTMPAEDKDALLSLACSTLRANFGIAHSTIQVEPEGFDQAARCDVSVRATG